MKIAVAREVDQSEADRKLLDVVIGSSGFKWVCGVLGAGVVALVVVGWNSVASDAASKNPDVVGAKADIDILKTEVKVLNATAQEHTIALSQAAADRKTSAEVQAKIFEAIKQLSSDVHAIDVHVATVDQKVDDLKDQRK